MSHQLAYPVGTKVRAQVWTGRRYVAVRGTITASRTVEGRTRHTVTDASGAEHSASDVMCSRFGVVGGRPPAWHY